MGSLGDVLLRDGSLPRWQLMTLQQEAHADSSSGSELFNCSRKKDGRHEPPCLPSPTHPSPLSCFPLCFFLLHLSSSPSPPQNFRNVHIAIIKYSRVQPMSALSKRVQGSVGDQSVWLMKGCLCLSHREQQRPLCAMLMCLSMCVCSTTYMGVYMWSHFHTVVPTPPPLSL